MGWLHHRGNDRDPSLSVDGTFVCGAFGTHCGGRQGTANPLTVFVITSI